MFANRTTAPLLLAAFFVIAYLLPLNAGELWQPDETRYAEISREMVESGDWIVPRFAGLRYFEKPIAGYWVNSISQILFGQSNFAVRFGSAASTAASAALVYALGFLLWRSRERAFAAAAIYLSMLLVLCIGTFTVLDPILTMWTSASMLAAWLTGRAKSAGTRAAAWAALGAASGMGLLTKGFLAPALPFFSMLPVIAVERRFKEMFIFGPLAVLTMIAVCLPWGLAVGLREPDFWRYFIFVEHINRFALESAQHKKPFWFYLPVLAAGCLPWLGLLPGALCRVFDGFGKYRSKDLFFLFCWFVVPFLFFSVAKGKLITYILPCMAPLALLMADHALNLTGEKTGGALKANAIVNICMGLAGIAALCFLFAGLPPGLDLYGDGEWTKLALGLCAFAAWTIIAFFCLRRERWLLAALCPVLVIALHSAVIPDQVNEGKRPLPAIRRYADVFCQSDKLVTNTPELASGLAFCTGRTDIQFLLDGSEKDAGELSYGLRQPDSIHRYIAYKDFSAWLKQARKEGDVALLLRLKSRIALLKSMPAPDILEKLPPYYFFLLYKKTDPKAGQ